MDKKEFQDIFKTYMRSQGFRVKGNCAYQFLDDQYVIGIYLDHHPYAEAYFIEYGAIYEPDSIQRQKTLSGKADYRMRFRFTANPNDDLFQYLLEDNCCFDRRVLIDYFEYSVRTENDFKYSMNINMEKRFKLLYNKDYVLEQYRNDSVLFRMIPYDTVYKIARLAGLDIAEVLRLRDKL